MSYIFTIFTKYPVVDMQLISVKNNPKNVVFLCVVSETPATLLPEIINMKLNIIPLDTLVPYRYFSPYAVINKDKCLSNVNKGTLICLRLHINNCSIILRY